MARSENLVGCVLCGGASRRMGGDKALAELGQRTLLERALGAFDGLAGPVLLATGSAPRYRELGLECVLDRTPDGGPLAGLEAALSWMVEAGRSEGWLLVVACDMPYVEPGVFRALLAAAEAERADLCLLEGERGVEPLLAVYHPRVLSAVRSALAAGERRMIAFHEGHGPLRVARLARGRLREGLEACLVNLNTPEELARARATGGDAGRDTSSAADGPRAALGAGGGR